MIICWCLLYMAMEWVLSAGLPGLSDKTFTIANQNSPQTAKWAVKANLSHHQPPLPINPSLMMQSTSLEKGG